MKKKYKIVSLLCSRARRGHPDDWRLWKRYKTERDRKQALKTLTSGKWDNIVEFKAAE